MITLNKIRQLDIIISWEIIRLGWIGPGDFTRQLSVEDINSFAELKINAASEIEIEYIAELCISKDEDNISENLQFLAPKITEKAERTWIVLLLIELLEDITLEPINGILELTDFWSSFGYPADSPHIIQGVGNNILPTDYYTKENYIKMLSNHRVWINKEIEILQNP